MAKAVPTEAVDRPASIQKALIDFRFGTAERFFSVKWGLSQAPDMDEFFKALSRFENKTMGELFGGRVSKGVGEGKTYSLDESSVKPREVDKKDHQTLIALLKALYGSCELSRIRVGGKVRVWGILQGNQFHVCLWDTEHGVYPMEPKNT